MSADIALQRERFGYWFSAFGAGPDTVLSLFWGPVMMVLAALDSTCAPDSDGLSSGADGQACTDTDDWNFALWELVNGSACGSSDALGRYKVSHDPTLSNGACGVAWALYRGATAQGGGLTNSHSAFTCNCSGADSDHSFLGGEGGLRYSVISILQINIVVILITFIAPVFGTFIDFSPHRKRSWTVLWLAGGISTCGMAILGQNFVWTIGLSFAFLTQLFTELVTVPRASYLPDIAFDDSTRKRLGGSRQAANVGAQLIFVAIMLVIIAFLERAALGATAALLCAVWYLGFTPISLRRMRHYPAKRERLEGKGMCAISWGELRAVVRETRQKYPEAAKYLAAIFCLQNGTAATFLTVVSQSFLPVSSAHCRTHSLRLGCSSAISAPPHSAVDTAYTGGGLSSVSSGLPGVLRG
jgi:hypothetical protein